MESTPGAEAVPEFPERFNLARHLLDARIEEGRGGRTAVRCGGESYTYADVQRLANRAGNALRALGVEPEDRVLLVLPDGIEFVATWFGALKVGGVFAMVNPLVPAEDFAYYLDYSRAKVAAVHACAWPEFSRALTGARHLRAALLVGEGEEACRAPAWARARAIPWCDATTEAGDALENEPTTRDDLAGWLFTSGSTGRPKAAVHHHRDFAFNAETYGKGILGMRESDVTLAVPKLFFGYATGTNLMFPFAVGASTCLFPERSTPEAVFEEIDRQRPTVLTSVPTMIHAMVSHAEAGRHDLSCLRVCISAGEALPPETYRRWKDAFGVEILDGIGSAEMFHIYVSNRFGEVRPGSLGRVVPGYEARLVGPDGLDVPEGELGTLWIRGGSTALCYWNDRDKSRATFRGDWAVTGDFFRRDAEGFYFYAGRADDLLKVGGTFVAPVEVEDCLLGHPAVSECAVVGWRDEADLVKPKAFVVLRAGHAPGEALARTLQEFVKGRLAPHKYPRRVEFVDSLPKNDRGKIDRKRLKA